MDYNANLEHTRKLLHFDSKIKHDFSDEFKLFPFRTRKERPEYKKFGFLKIIGEFSRLLYNKKLDNDLSLDYMMENLDEKIDYDSEDKKYLRAIINDYLFDDTQQISILHPYLYLYVPESSSKDIQTGDFEIAKFLRDVMFYDFPQIKKYFSLTGNENVSKNNALTSLILENLPELNNKKVKSKYFPKLDYVLNVFRKDISYAMEYEDFFNKNIEDLFAYYYFFYISQLALKLKTPNGVRDNDIHINEVEKLFYLVDGESVSSTRETIDVGYKKLVGNTNHLISKIRLIDYVNTLLGTKGLITSELRNEVYNLSEEDFNKFITVFKSFIREYMENSAINDKFDLNDDFDHLFNILYECLVKNETATSSRYSLSLTDVATNYFIKNGGRHGNVLNINQNMLIAITALCIPKDKDKIKRNDLFKEYEKRGLFFDKKSQIEVDKILTKLDLIDKKSDSGDAQYVKRIL